MSDQEHHKQNGFGADVIQLLLPHRRPFLMVDRVESYALGDEPALRASRHISANESVFEGHFPSLSMWPGVYTIEGLGQASMLLAVLVGLHEAAAARGVTAEEIGEALRNLDAGFHLRPGYRPGLSDRLVEALGPPGTHLGLASDVDVKLLHPVFAGQRLDYVARLTRRLGRVQRFEVDAAVDGVPVARGTLGSVHEGGGVAGPGFRARA
jgi:3-hydroxyacyl-[acyl-carrier-protein] dehydratase